MPGEPFTKLFYKIGEVCRLTGIRPHILRYWESEFTALSPKKSGGGQRVYQKKDLETILAIKRMLYEEGYTIAGARKALSGRSASKDAGTDRVESRPAATADTPKDNTSDARGDAPDKRFADALGKFKEEIQDLLKFIG